MKKKIENATLYINEIKGIYKNEAIRILKNNEYYSNELDKGSEKKYKNKCLTVDLTTGKVTGIDKAAFRNTWEIIEKQNAKHSNI